jgi:anti-sigma factor ChrR (cupin superfamily)
MKQDFKPMQHHPSTGASGAAMTAIRLNADWSQRCVVDSTRQEWHSSPCDRVHRRLLERDGGEVARATSIVRYAPGAQFDSHLHDLGEEIFVLEGTLSDEAGDYGAGTYLKNPPGSRHAPSSQHGCTLFVKLRHLDPDDRERVVINTRQAPWRQGLVDGLRVLPLSEFGTTHTALVRWAPGTFFNPHRHYGGEEILVIEGVFSDEHGDYPAGSWLRSPHLSQHQPFSREGCLILVKTGHLLAD